MHSGHIRNLMLQPYQEWLRVEVIFTYSCSQVVDKISFAEAVFSAAASTGRNVRILHRLTQPADHPVNIYHPEGEYLKGLVIYVE